jgi:hypothetical protein
VLVFVYFIPIFDNTVPAMEKLKPVIFKIFLCVKIKFLCGQQLLVGDLVSLTRKLSQTRGGVQQALYFQETNQNFPITQTFISFYPCSSWLHTHHSAPGTCTQNSMSISG